MPNWYKTSSKSLHTNFFPSFPTSYTHKHALVLLLWMILFSKLDFIHVVKVHRFTFEFITTHMAKITGVDIQFHARKKVHSSSSFIHTKVDLITSGNFFVHWVNRPLHNIIHPYIDELYGWIFIMKVLELGITNTNMGKIINQVFYLNFFN